MQNFNFLRYALIGFYQRRREKRKEKKKEEKKLPKIVAYGCQTTSAQRSSDQWLSISAYTDWGQLERDKREKIVDT